MTLITDLLPAKLLLILLFDTTVPLGQVKHLWSTVGISVGDGATFLPLFLLTCLN